MSQMITVLAVASVLSLIGPQLTGTALDVSGVRVGVPTLVSTLDLGKLKGELRQIGWSPDRTELYVQTADGNPPAGKLRHYIVLAAGGATRPVDVAPDWARGYWDYKSDRFAPGLPSLMIQVEQRAEKLKVGTGSGRPGEQASGAPGTIPVDIEKTAEGQFQNVARLTFAGETVSEFVNEKPIPGLMFSWGPIGSGAIAYTDRDMGRLMLLDQHRHKQTISGIKDASLPAWSEDGSRLAWVQKDGRRKYVLMAAKVEIKG